MDKDKRSSVISDITVERLDNRSVRICWKTECRDLGVSIRYGTSPTGSGAPSGHAVRVVGVNCAEVSGLDPDRRYYFRVVPDGEKGMVIGERQVHLEGAVNFRDLGGYRSSDGRRVRWGQVFRSDSLARLTERDRMRVEHLGLKLVIDFRTPNEVRKSPDRLPQSSTIRYLNLPITHGEFDFVSAMERIKKGDDSWLTEDFMLSGYIHNLDEFAHTWGEVIRRLIKPKNRPLLFHCTGGKDRAGICAALILLALGVHEETVIDDHQLSNILIADLVKDAYKRIASYGVDPRKLSPYFTAPLECIIGLLDHLHKTYGSPVDYLEAADGVNRETLSLLKEALLE
jgi:protein-tyrosine phosphatase